MIREPTEGLPVDRMTVVGGGDAFNWISGHGNAVGRETGWDPYEVWRTRVKLASDLQREVENPTQLPAAK